MRFHLPKPLRGWRSFIGEISIIVLGVLIALGAQQLVESWNWSRKVAGAEEQLKRESSLNFLYAAEMATVQPCIDAQLDELRRRLLDSGATLKPAPLYDDDFSTFVFRQPSRPYVDETWKSLTDDGTAPNLDDWRRNQFSETYAQLANLRELGGLSAVSGGRLRVLSESIPLDPGTRVRLLEQIAEQRTRAKLQGVITAQVMASMRDLGQAPPAARVDLYLATESGTVKFCRGKSLPLADWRNELAQEPVETAEDDTA